MGNFISHLKVRWEDVGSTRGYPYTLPAVQSAENIHFDSRCTFFIGENGSGKSTILEAIAVAFGFSGEGGSLEHRFSTFNSHSNLEQVLEVHRNFPRPREGFFLRAESLYNVASYLAQSGSSRYGDLHACSHGESFLHVMEGLKGTGLYLLDEPEAALSPQRQLSFLLQMDELIKKESQFIVATHSPIILSYPGAAIFQFSEDGIERVEYEETEHYRFTRDFLTHREVYLRHLMRETLDPNP